MYADLLDEGYACLRRGDPEAALSRFQRAAECESERPQAYFAMAMAHLERGSNEAVKRALETALQVDPSYVPARAYLAIELLKCYELDAAQRELDLALKHEPANLLAHIKYAEYYYRLGFYHRAVDVLERGLKGHHGANEHIVAMARQFLTQARQKTKGIILREPPDPRGLLSLLARFRPGKGKQTLVTGKARLS